MAKTDKSDDELKKLGEMLVNLHELGYTSKRRLIGISFLKGLAYGLGAFIGGTIVIALLLWVLGLFDSVPLLDGVVESIKNSLNVAN